MLFEENQCVFSLCDLDTSLVDDKTSFSPFFFVDLSMPFLPNNQEDTFVFSTGYSEVIIPCRVTNPNATVSLHEKRVNDPAPGMYFPQQGFKGQFEDKAYICKATIEDEEFESETFYVYNLQGESWINVYMFSLLCTALASVWSRKDSLNENKTSSYIGVH